jgi:two-component system, OmpR family, response regulator
MNRKALIVEDERDTGELLIEILRRKNFDATLLLEGKPAVPWVYANQPDLILLDLMLPDIDGYSICEELKLDRETNLVPVIMVTARDQHSDKIHGLQVGANFYLTKPFSVEQLNSAINDVFAWRDDMERRGTSGEIHFQLQSDTQYLEELNHLLASLFLFSGLTPTQIRQLTTAVSEIGTNAIEWGHRKDANRIVTVTYQIDPEKVAILVRDTGPGFNPKQLAHAAQPEDPTKHMMVREALGMRDGGFGILMARGLVDDLQYNETGNEVKLIKYFAAKPAVV